MMHLLDTSLLLCLLRFGYLANRGHGFVGTPSLHLNRLIPSSVVKLSELPSLYSSQLRLRNGSQLHQSESSEISEVEDDILEEVDVAIIGAGLGGLCAGAILNTLYGKSVGVYESHYLPGGCAHAFVRKASNGMEFTFDSGPTILLGCSKPPYNPLQQILDAVDQKVEWIPYKSWGMIENPGQEENEIRWSLELGPDVFEEGPLKRFGGETALEEFRALREATKGLLAGIAIPAMAMRSGNTALIPLLRYFSTLIELIQQGELNTATFAPFMDGPIFVVKDKWLRNWLDALAFSLSGLPASRTAAAAMAFVLYDMHRPEASLDYPKGGFGEVVNALVRGVEQGSKGRSKVHLRQHVQTIDCSEDGSRILGITLKSGKKIKARNGVICNVPVWSIRNMIQDENMLAKFNGYLPDVEKKPRQTWEISSEGKPVIQLNRPTVSPEEQASLLAKCDTSEMTGSFLHLHVAIDSKGLDVSKMEAHYTVMDRSLAGNGGVVDGVPDGPCGELNMIAVSNPCVIDKSLAPENYMIVHAYFAANEPYELWAGMKRTSEEYREMKERRSEALWRAIESVIPDVRKRTVLSMIGSPLTHERFLRRPRGTYGSATEDYLADGSTPFDTLVLAGDGIFPGIGMPAVAINGASAANSMVNVFEQWFCLGRLKKSNKIL